MLEYIMLTLIRGFGPVSQNRLLDLCGMAERCFTLTEEKLLELDRKNNLKSHALGERQIHSFVEQRYGEELRQKAEEIRECAQKAGVTLITKEDCAYPDRFRPFPDMPVLLYLKGSLRANEYGEIVGIIGARRCSREGKDSAIRSACEAVRNGKAVVSGMAKGIDSYAHTAAIKEKGYTIAVLGNGPDICYPVEHQALYDEIVANGCIVSECPPNTRPRNYLFPRRNRLIAALSDELLVIDAGQKSGTRTTVMDCERYGRRVARI